MTKLTFGNKGTSTGYLCHRLHSNLYQFKKRVFLDKLTISSTGPSPYKGRAIVVRYSDIGSLGVANTRFDARSYAILTSYETDVTVNGDTVFTFPRTIALEPNVTYAIGVSFDNEDTGNAIYMNTDISPTSDVVLNSDVTLKAENIYGGKYNHATNYYFYNSGNPSFHNWAGNNTFWQILDYSDATDNLYVYPNIPAKLKVGDSITFNYSGASQLLNRPEIGKVRVELYGAQGGFAADSAPGSPGGYGGKSVADFYVRGKPLYVYVGGFPGRSSTGGFNGGGTCQSGVGGGGGGATDVRLNSSTLADRIVVAGGGGGGAYENASWLSGGGHGGGANMAGINGGKGYSEGGQLTRGGNLGGTLGNGASYGQNGASYGGNQNGGGAGGGGYYGGGMANSNTEDYAGAGGSGYADTSKCTNIVGQNGGNYNTSSGGTSWSGHGRATITILELNANPPSSPSINTTTPSTLKFNESVELGWNAVSKPTQPNGVILDIDKVLYETVFTPSGSNVIIMETNLESLKTNIRPIIGSLSGGKFGIRAFVIAYGVKYYSPITYTNTFSVDQPPINTTYPNALIFNGTSDYADVNQRLIPVSTDFTWEGFFRTTENKNMTIFQVTSITNVSGLKFSLNVTGNPVLITKQNITLTSPIKLNDGKLHHYAITRSGNKYSLYIDNQLITYATSADNYSDSNRVIIADDYNASSKFNGLIGLPRIWTDVRTDEELMNFKNKIVPDNEQGLYDYIYFNDRTGLLGMKKNTSFIVTMYNSTYWSYTFSTIDEVSLPYPDDYQRAENLHYLRSKINEMRSSNGLSAMDWTDPIIVQGYTPIKAIHWNEVEGALNNVYEDLGQPISSPEVKEQFEEEIIPKDKNFPVKNLKKRMKNILKGLKNE